MYNLLDTVIGMSITASYVIVFILLFRILLHKIAPKNLSYGLWAVVAFRLLVPFSFESPFCFIPSKAAILSANSSTRQIQTHLYTQIIVVIWLIGVVGLCMYHGYTYVKFRAKLKDAKYLGDNIYEVETLKTPFVFGIVSSKVYIPKNLSKEEQQYIILHELTHIKRHDPLIKAVALLVCSIHWFNPFVWIAFNFLSMDMELSCDECVIKKLDTSVKKAYAKSIVDFSCKSFRIEESPVTFAHKNVKRRIFNILKYRETKKVHVLLGGILFLVVVLGLCANPKTISDAASRVIYLSEDRIRDISPYEMERVGVKVHLFSEPEVVQGKKYYKALTYNSGQTIIEPGIQVWNMK